jgi:7-cyano-7-deazaguanine reductase
MPADGKLLKTIKNEYHGREYEVVLHCPEFTSLCPFTGYPDFGVIDIIYTPGKKCIESKSLKLYIMSYRDERIFNEDAVNRILDDIVAVCRPVRAKVVGSFNVRGGIAIRVEAGSNDKRKSRRND